MNSKPYCPGKNPFSDDYTSAISLGSMDDYKNIKICQNKKKPNIYVILDANDTNDKSNIIYKGEGKIKDTKTDMKEFIKNSGTEYNKDGKVVFEGNYTDGKKRTGRGERIGNGIEYKDGEIVFNGDYKDGERWNGKGKWYKEYKNDDKLVFEGEIKEQT